MVEVWPVEVIDMIELARNMRQCDIDEVLAAGGMEPLDAVVASVRVSPGCSAVRINGELACIFGCAPIGGSLLSPIGAPWMLATPVLDRNPRTLMTHCRRYVAEMLKQYPVLINYVDARNTRSIRWLSALGFEFEPAKPWGSAGLPFYRFEMRRDHV